MERKPRLEGKVAVVVGAGARGEVVGNGQAVSILFAREGSKVLLVDISAERAQKTLQMIKEEGGEASIFEADVTKEDNAKKIMEAVVKRYGRLDILHNNVGISGPKTVLDTTEEEWDRVMTVNLKSMMFCCKHAIPRLKETGGGSIINISSLSGLRAQGLLAYAASKHGVVGLTKVMAVQHAKDNIRVNCIAPGPAYTCMVAEGMTKEIRELRRTSVPMEIEGTAWDVAWAAVYFASDEAKWVTGVVLPVDGGLSVTTRQRYRI